MTVRNSVIRGLLTRKSGWSRLNANAEWSFESSDGSDSQGSTPLTLVNTTIIAGSTGLALDTGTTGYGFNATDITGVQSTQGTLDCLVRFPNLGNDVNVIYYATKDNALGSSDHDEFFFARRTDGRLQVAIHDGGVVKISWVTAPGTISDTGYHRLTLTGDGSGTNPVGYKIYVDGVLQAIDNKSTDVSGYRGIWLGDPLLSSIDTVSIGALFRGGPSFTGNIISEFTRSYSYVKLQAQITDEQAIIGGEK